MSVNETLTEAMHGLVDDEYPFLGDVVVTGMTRGKQIHRKRRAGQVIGSTAAVAAVATIGTFAVGGPLTAGAAGSDPKDNPFVTELGSQIKVLLPGVSYKVSAGGTKAGGADAALSDSLKTSVHIESGYSGTTHPPRGFCGSNGALEPYAHCTMSTLPDGTWLEIITSRGNSYDKSMRVTGNVETVQVSVNRANGTYVSMEQSTGKADPASGATSLPAFPLTVDQMKAFIQQPVWTRIATPIPADLIPDFAAGMPTATIAKHLKPLLPDGLEADDAGLNVDPAYNPKPDGNYYTIVNDGRGKSLLQMSVSPTKDGFDAHVLKPNCDGPDDVDCHITAQPDGSVLKVWKDPAGSGSLADLMGWHAALFGKDTVASVEETNGPTVVGPADRNTMPLSADQLADIVKNTVWSTLK